MTSRTRNSVPRDPSEPVPVLRELALLADGERGALVGPLGDIVWMCAPGWDDDGVFSSLIGGAGRYQVRPAGRFTWGGYYEGDSLIWRSRWVTGAGIVECREALAYPAQARRLTLLRRILAHRSPARVRVVLEPRAGFGRHPMRVRRTDDSSWIGECGPLSVRFRGGRDVRPVRGGERLELDLVIPAGTTHDLVLELSDRSLQEDPLDPDAAWLATESAWSTAVPALSHSLDPPSTRRSYAVLRGLTGPAGGMVAAATTSLPERSRSGRNYDYRYVWIRDQSYAGQAAAALGDEHLVDAAVRFVTERLLEHGADLRPAYTVRGDPVPEQRKLNLPGYPGGSDIVGNHVKSQFQLDVFGESLLLLAAAGRLDRLDAEHWSAVQLAAAAIEQRWTEDDAGIWEIDNRAWTHSRLICAAGLRAVARIDPSSGRTADRLSLADRIVADTAAHATRPDGCWQRSRDDAALDAALLLPPLRGAVTADDPRTIATLGGYLQALTDRGHAYRFRHDDRPLAYAEGAFTLCGFLVCLSLHQQGRTSEAIRWYERIRADTGPAQLYAEEYDINQHQLRGNLPQAFVHALHLETAVRLTEPGPTGPDP